MLYSADSGDNVILGTFRRYFVLGVGSGYTLILGVDLGDTVVLGVEFG